MQKESNFALFVCHESFNCNIHVITLLIHSILILSLPLKFQREVWHTLVFLRHSPAPYLTKGNRVHVWTKPKLNTALLISTNVWVML